MTPFSVPGAEIGLPISQALGVTDKVVQGIIQGAVGGIAGSATSSALSGGGYIGRDILIGAISGGIGGGLGGAFAGSDPAVRLFLKMGSGALIGGAAAELTGGKFAQGAIIGAASGAISAAVEQYAIDQEKYSNTMPGRRDMILQELSPEQRQELFGPEGKGFIELKNLENHRLMARIESLGRDVKFGNWWIDFKRSLDVVQIGGAWESKIGQIHLRGYSTHLYVGWDPFDIVTHFGPHLLFDVWSSK